MGYYSDMNATTFLSEMGEEEVSKEWNSFVAAQNNDDMNYLKMYEIKPIKSGGREYEIYMDDYYAKHYANQLLAEFISKIVSTNDYCTIKFLGEDADDKWGWLILRNEIYEIAYTESVRMPPPSLERMPISEFLKENYPALTNGASQFSVGSYGTASP